MMPRIHRPMHSGEHGLTLIELLVAIVISVMVGLAVFSILYSTYKGRESSAQLTGRIDRADLMKEALEHTVTLAGYTGYLQTSNTPCTIGATPTPLSLPLSTPQSVSTLTVKWRGGSNNCQVCTGTFTLTGNIATWAVTGVSCGSQNTAIFPVGTGWTLSASSLSDFPFALS
jgi:Tfp pilus assembly protein PilW